MSKGKRLREERRAAEYHEPQRPPATPTEKPSIAKAKRQRRRKAFREWQKLPLAVRRAPFNRNTTATNPDQETDNG